MKTPLVRLGFCFCILAFAAPAMAGEYYIYRDSKGGLVLSNFKSRRLAAKYAQQTLTDSPDTDSSQSTESTDNRVSDRTESQKLPRS